MASARLALVLLPGMDGSGELFAGFIAALGDAVAPIMVSYPPREVLDYAGLTAFARERLPAGQRFVLLGESFSGPVAIALAASHPPGLAGLILSCTFARNPLPFLRVFQSLLDAMPMSPSLSGLASPFLLGLRAPAAQRRAVRSAVARVAPPVLRARMRAVLQTDFSEQMRAVRVPILYLQSRQDPVVPAGAVRHLLSLQPDMKVVALRAPHLLLQAVPEQAAAAVVQFIGTLQAGR
jgi:pimeloyl-[acyl-carrier protein] methyl ester esterase